MCYLYLDWYRCAISISTGVLVLLPAYEGNLMPTLSYCKSVNKCSPKLLLFKISRYEKLYFGPFFLALRFGPVLHSCLFVLHNAHTQHALCPALLFPTPCSAFALPAFDLSPFPALPCLLLPCFLLPCMYGY